MNTQPNHDPRRRRGLLHGLLTAGTALGPLPAVAHRYTALLAQHEHRARVSPAPSPYGTLAPLADESTGLVLLELPPGFRYRSLAWAGDPMRDGQPCPANHDGMGVIGGEPGRDEWLLVRNHELWKGQPFAAPARYDRGEFTAALALSPAGGTTTLRVREGRLVSLEPSLGGTMLNCAGGVTPWGTWLSCEEVRSDVVSSTGARHGYVFEVCPPSIPTSARPIRDMGRFRHEAAAVDPRTGFVYLSEDDRHHSGLYRFIPHLRPGHPGSLEAGGRLQAARVRGRPRADLRNPAPGERHRIDWVDIDAPDADSGPLEQAGADAPGGPVSGPFRQAWAQGALRMSRGEGLWVAERTLVIVDTEAGRDRLGRIGHGPGALWALDLEQDTLVTLFANPDPLAANSPDNVCISPRGGLLFCEDGAGIAQGERFGNRLMGVSPDGASFVFARNAARFDLDALAGAGKRCAAGDYRSAEFAGACFDPGGRWLFVNIYAPGITLAITGPWQQGPL